MDNKHLRVVAEVLARGIEFAMKETEGHEMSEKHFEWGKFCTIVEIVYSTNQNDPSFNIFEFARDKKEASRLLSLCRNYMEMFKKDHSTCGKDHTHV